MVVVVAVVVVVEEGGEEGQIGDLCVGGVGGHTVVDEEVVFSHAFQSTSGFVCVCVCVLTAAHSGVV